MKKTAQTLLTAAMFATALGNSAANASTGMAYAAARTADTTTSLTTTTVPPLYGPPWVLSSIEAERQKTATTQTTTVDEEAETTTTALDLSEIPLTGTYNLQLSVLDIDTQENVPDLECEFFNMQTGEIVLTWNTSQKPKVAITKLEYEFERWDAFGSITYGIRIKNMPENYTFALYGGRDEAPVSGDSISDFANSTVLRTAVYLTDSNRIATGTRPDDEPYQTTTMRPDDEPYQTTPVVLYGPPWVFYPTGDVNMDNVTDARDLSLIKQLALNPARNTGYMERNIADVNHDGEVDKEDVRIFMEETLGIPKDEEEPVTTTTVTTSPDENPDIVSSLESTTRATDVIVLYGPPSMRE